MTFAAEIHNSYVKTTSESVIQECKKLYDGQHMGLISTIFSHVIYMSHHILISSDMSMW